MSYCRFGGKSDLYIIRTEHSFECLACKLMADDYTSWHGETLRELYDHLIAHTRAGHKVPERAFHRVVNELVQEGVYVHQKQELEVMLNRLFAPTIMFSGYIRFARALQECKQALDELDSLNWPEDDDGDNGYL